MPHPLNLCGRFGVQALILTGLLLCGTVLVAAERVVVTRKDGREISGKLIETNEQAIILDIAGIHTTLPRDTVDRVTPLPSPEAVRDKRRAELDDDDILGRAALIRELADMRAYQLARDELADLQQQLDENANLDRLARYIDAHERLHRQQADEAGQAADTEAEPAGRLTSEQINRIRVYEVQLEERPRVQVPRSTLDKVFVRYGDHESVPRDRTGQAAIRREPGHRQLALIFELEARELYNEVKIHQDPPALRTFRSQIHRQYVLNYCATNQCHGGEAAPGDFRLWRTYSNTDATVYSNFLLLNQIANEQGKMIDRDMPERSLLLQYGLARNYAVSPHPSVPGWRPYFRTSDDGRISRYTRFISQLHTPAPDYQIDYTLGTSPPDEPAP